MITVCILWAFVILFFVLASIKRKKVRILPSICITASIVFFALLSPYGQILAKIGSFKITLGALLLGLKRSAILVGMVFLSQIFINTKIKLPGKAGNFLQEVFTWVEKLTSIKIQFKPGSIIQSIDERLCQIWENSENE